MLEIIEFVFSSFWVWSGTVVLVAIMSFMVVGTLNAVAQIARRR